MTLRQLLYYQIAIYANIGRAMKHFRIGEFAHKAGVTVRTIRYYDRIGLLQPSARSEANQRLYTEMDFARLLQILTLKLIGLSLEDISRVLASDTASIFDLLDRQKVVLQVKSQQLLAVIQTIEKAQRVLSHSTDLDLEHFVNIIKAVTMNSQSQWFSQFITDEQRRSLAEASNGRVLDSHNQDGLAWRSLFRDVFNNMERDITDPGLQVLVERWDALMEQYLPSNSDVDTAAISAALNRAFSHIDQLPDIKDGTTVVREWAQTLSEVAAFIQEVREARKR